MYHEKSTRKASIKVLITSAGSDYKRTQKKTRNGAAKKDHGSSQIANIPFHLALQIMS